MHVSTCQNTDSAFVRRILGFMPTNTDQTPTEHDQSKRTQARSLYWQGWRVSMIAEFLELPYSTIQTWKKSEQWESATPIQRIEGALEARIVQLIHKDNKSNGDKSELDSLFRGVERIARVNKYSNTGKEADLNPNINNRNAVSHTSGKRKNWFNEKQIKLIREEFMETNFEYQKQWYEMRNQRTRFILKSRQIGATFYFGREALLDAIDTARNQLFISASKNQARVFRQYIMNLAQDAADVKLTGDDIILGNGTELRFLGTNHKTAQGYHGNLYMDECMWINQFAKINKVARGMSTHKQYRRSYITTPSVQSHEAYPFWSGEAYNKNRKAENKVIIDLSDVALRAGTLGGDRIWRQRVTIHDAQAGGCDLFDIEELIAENSPDEFANLYLCEFIDDSLSVFSFSQMQNCMVDADLEWDDFRPYSSTRPYGNKPVWIGHDAGLTGDGAATSVVAPPDQPGGKFRQLERKKFKGATYEEQAKAIYQLTKKYNVDYLAIDITGGYGSAVYELVKKFFPRVKAINYNLENKTRMVLKAQMVINKGRYQFDAGDTELARAFMSIRRALTQSQKNMTFETGRNEETGHGEAAWATMHTFINEPLDEATVGRKKGRMWMSE